MQTNTHFFELNASLLIQVSHYFASKVEAAARLVPLRQEIDNLVG